MVMEIYRNLHHALPREIVCLLTEGYDTPSRDGSTVELLHRTVKLILPMERFQFHPARADNPFAKIAETLWVLAGRDDVQWLARYLPRAPRFSDNGVTWRAGYGPRLRRWPGAYAGQVIDQVWKTAQMLRDDPDTRRAVISLWDPARDAVLGSLDYPCNNWLSFIIRRNVLSLAVAVRSNDVWWGWSGINTFEWSVLLEAMAFWTGTVCGPLTTFVGSWHLYERHWARARRVVHDMDVSGSNPYTENNWEPVRWGVPLDSLDRELANFFRVESQMRHRGTDADPFPIGIDLDSIQDPFLHKCALMLFIYNELQNGAPKNAVEEYIHTCLEGTDFGAAAQVYVNRHFVFANGEDASSLEETARE